MDDVLEGPGQRNEPPGTFGQHGGLHGPPSRTHPGLLLPVVRGANDTSNGTCPGRAGTVAEPVRRVAARHVSLGCFLVRDARSVAGSWFHRRALHGRRPDTSVALVHNGSTRNRKTHARNNKNHSFAGCAISPPACTMLDKVEARLSARRKWVSVPDRADCTMG